MNDVLSQGQTISFCGVNAHFQSGIAKRRIRELQDGAQTSLIHAKHRWGLAIKANLWPYALRHRNDVFNSMQCNKQQLSPIEIFLNSNVRPKLKHFHPIGCPADCVGNSIQSGKNYPKWLEQSKPVVYLGSSPQHARSVSLVLDLQTAHVSPQFHLRYDNLFETVSPGRINPQAKLSIWQKLCGFWGNNKSEIPVVALPVISDRRVDAAEGTIGAKEQHPPVMPEIPDDPDGNNSLPGDLGDINQDHFDDKVRPFGNPVAAPGPISVSRAGQTRTQTLRFI
jgi:hypothetical protein